MSKVLEILSKSESFLTSKGVPNAKFDAQTMLAKILKCKRLDLFLRFEQELTENELNEYREYVRRRSKREPLQHILGDVEFANLTLKCDARALVPRHETEELCAILFERLKGSAPAKILDLGTGGGAIILALKNAFPSAECFALDASAEALSLAKENARKCGFEINFIESKWFENIDGVYDLIVSNPPYLTREEVENAEAEVKNFDPPSALASPENGLADLRQIIKNAPQFLTAQGLLALECGANQPSVLKAENETNKNFSDIEIIFDSYKRERFLFLKKF